MILAHKIEFKPSTKEQETLLRKSCGVARFVYNWALDYWQTLTSATLSHKGILSFSPNSVKKYFNSIKREQFPFVMEVCAAEQAFVNLSEAIKRHEKGLSREPVHKKKGKRDSFYVSNDKFTLVGKKLRLPKIGWVKLTETLRFTGKILNLVVSQCAGRWYVSIQVELDEATEKANYRKDENADKNSYAKPIYIWQYTLL